MNHAIVAFSAKSDSDQQSRRVAGLPLHLLALPGLLILLACIYQSAGAQSGQWAWMGGTGSRINQGTYGTLGVPAIGNFPGGRTGAATWTDKSGNLWLFGGDGFDMFMNAGPLNDLWKFNPTTGEWAWMAGSNATGPHGGQPGVYGTLGTPAPENTPGSRSGAATWTDSTGNLWLFGGYGTTNGINSPYLNDLWEFNHATMEWAWMGGSDIAGSASAGYGPGDLAPAKRIP
jgi:N-acetylneuraminic acid mutarotase